MSRAAVRPRPSEPLPEPPPEPLPEPPSLLGPGRFPLPLPGWEGLEVTARVPRSAPAGLRRHGPGDVVRLALVIAVREIRPVVVGADRWRTDERGRVDARGTLGRVGPDDPRCRPGTLEVAGRPWALDEGTDVRPGRRVDVAGVLLVADGCSRAAAALARPWTIRGRRLVVPGVDADLAAFSVVDLAPR